MSSTVSTDKFSDVMQIVLYNHELDLQHYVSEMNKCAVEIGREIEVGLALGLFMKKNLEVLTMETGDWTGENTQYQTAFSRDKLFATPESAIEYAVLNFPQALRPIEAKALEEFQTYQFLEVPIFNQENWEDRLIAMRDYSVYLEEKYDYLWLKDCYVGHGQEVFIAETGERRVVWEDRFKAMQKYAICLDYLRSYKFPKSSEYPIAFEGGKKSLIIVPEFFRLGPFRFMIIPEYARR